ncbi:MAG: 4Fe-4S binding protein [Muribaculaceae bacterium]|nr:4Fe-4S binding protein [Muribaculaceae bacterium]
MLKKIRIIIGVLSLLAVTLLFVDVSGVARHYWGWMAKIQFIPALLAMNVLAVLFLIALTLLLGRVYCSVICPLGIWQDVVIRLRTWFGGAKKKRKNRFGYAPAWRRTRLTVVTCFCVLLVLGLTTATAAAFAGLLEPYSAYGRIASQVFAPAYDWLNNCLAGWSETNGNYMFTPVQILVVVPVLIVASITFVIVTAMAWIGGRDYCNIICPVGTILGYMSKYALLRPMIDTSRCNGCRKCERNCKARCINGKEHKIDHTRCVACMDCLDNCSTGAIRYTWRRGRSMDKTSAGKSDDTAGRRAFLLSGGMIAGALAVKASVEGDGALAAIKEKKTPLRKTPIVPPGALGLVHLGSHCTACQLCVRACPEGVLRPSTELDSFMQPRMEFTSSYCRPECTSCSDVCPAGAILPLDAAAKSAVKIGRAVVDLGQCISVNGQKCGNCSRQCPSGAITMVPVDAAQPEGRLMPVVCDDRCIGCGACEYSCPVGTAGIIESDHSAIHVEGIEIHREL